MKKIIRPFLIGIAGIVLIAGIVSIVSGRIGYRLGHKQNMQQQAIYYCPMHPTYTSDRPGECAICHMKLVKMEISTQEVSEKNSGGLKEFTVEELMKMKPGEICLLHKCTMGTCMMAMTEEIARFGKCPHCGEDLGIVIKEALPDGYGRVALSEVKQQAIGVRTAAAQRQVVTKTIRTVGTIAHDPELYQAQAEYLEALHTFHKAEEGNVSELTEQAKRLVESAKLRLQYIGFDQDLIQEIEASGKADASLLFDRSGEHVWIYAKIYEYELPLIQKGQEVSAEVPSAPENIFRGVVRSIDPTVDPMTRTTRIRVQVKNPAGDLKPDMYVNVIISVSLGNVLAVPKEAVFDTGKRKIIFVDRGAGAFEPRDVVVGASTGTAYEIKQGIAEGEQVVISGNFLMDSESRLKAALQSAGSGGHQHGG